MSELGSQVVTLPAAATNPGAAAVVQTEPGQLSRALGDRQVQFIAIGGAIGAGLFLASGEAIHKAGPGLLLDYLITGIIVFLIARALGELAIYRPVAGSFASYAEEFIGPWAGFLTGWSYWLNWILAGIAEVSAIEIYFHYWYPDLPQWIPALCAVMVLYGANVISVKLYGEIEFWLSLVKVVTILAMIALGSVIIFFGLKGTPGPADFSNLWSHGGVFPHGAMGVLLALPIAAFSFGGTEVLGLTAGEVKDPSKSLPKAFNGIIYRILIFYIGALTVIMTLYPWDQLDPTASPFVLVFARIGLPAAAAIVNIVVISAAASACNSGLFATSRMLYSMSGSGQAPRFFSHLNKHQVPSRCLAVSVAMMLLGVLLNYLVPASVFNYAITGVLVFLLWTWIVIMVSHMRYRRAVQNGTKPGVAFRLPGSPVTNWLVLGFVGVIVILMAFDPETRTAFYFAAAWFVVLGAIYFALGLAGGRDRNKTLVT
ncbi:amino acid permease [Mesorhizobium sp. PAMC28654]|uniref:amino acid permease n=1 Tax=Mesorhizobium sp. PAMC28654 TaxID=2880934 RepID=UPI001D0A69F2|nr:amino acid permease [Mesorhizobium sp. PAMC28654]UDL90828.1 amino acid permease [Mesorhizobium sp. PAMC28654]